MAEPWRLSPEDVARLQDFHAVHFPGQQIPNVPSSLETKTVSDEARNADSGGLGFYIDGVRRSLTKDQIKMFRHSEIQRLLSERRQARHEAEEAQERAEHREEERARKRKFYDDARQQQDNIQDLTYDEPVEQNGSDTAEKTFLWPKLRA